MKVELPYQQFDFQIPPLQTWHEKPLYSVNVRGGKGIIEVINSSFGDGGASWLRNLEEKNHQENLIQFFSRRSEPNNETFNP